MSSSFTMQSSWGRTARPHVAIILDGNGRWAERRGLPRSAGHRAGARAVRKTVEAAVAREVSVLTLFAFSADNWRRPRPEVEALMGLFRGYLETEAGRCREQGVRLEAIGRRDRLPPGLVAAIDRAEDVTAEGDRLLLRIAIDYSSRQALARAAVELAERGVAGGSIDEAAFADALERSCRSAVGAHAVDLLIRTSGEQRLSDFLLWETAYAELFFTPTLWPDFDAADLDRALDELGRRERRFGGLPPQMAAAGG